MPDTKLRLSDTKLRFMPLREEDECFFSRERLAKRWDCSEKAVIRAEKRLGLRPYRILRAVKYALSDILRVEANGLAKMPKKFVGLRPEQKAELLRREQEEISQPIKPLKNSGRTGS